MSIPTDSPAVSEPDNHSDSDWLDIASTDRDSDDNDSIYSSRETDHEDLSRSRSRRSSLSYGSSRDGDVDAWEGLIDDSADEGMPNDVLAPNPHVPSLSQPSAAFDSNPTQETSPEELRINEGLDQSMISTLSSSRSSSLHASTIHTSSRDLRLSFPDPITSACRELLSTSYEEIQCNSDTLSSPTDSDAPSATRQVDDEDMDMLSASQMLSTQPQGTSTPSPSGPELKIFLYGFSTIFKWSLVNRLLQKVVHGAGLTVSTDLDNLQGSIRQLTVSGSFEHDRAFPRIITVLDKTLHPHDTVDDLALTGFDVVRPLAIVFMPCSPLHLPEHVLRLPILVSSACSSELPDLSIVETGSPQGAWGIFSIPDYQILRISTPEDPPVIDTESIDTIDSSRAYRAFSRLWSADNNTSKNIMASTHALTIIAILSLVLGVVVRTAIPISLQQFTSPTLATLNPSYASGSLWQMLRPAPYRERLPPSTTLDSSVVAMPSPFKDHSLSIFSAESTSMTLSHTNPTNFRRVVPSTLSERSRFSTDIMLQPSRSLLPPDNRPKALSVIPETTPTTSYHSGPVPTGHTVSALVHTSVPGVVKECAAVAFSTMSQDMQDILDALDALVQAISRQTQIILAQATTLIEQSAKHWEKRLESIEMIKETLHAGNERARKHAKEIRERGTKWLYDASGAVAASAEFSKGMAWEMAEGLAHRAQHARGKAKEMAAEIQDFLSERDTLEALGTGTWYTHTKHWDEWVDRVREQGLKGKSSCKPSKRKLKSAILC
ncbi:hypothetical protein EV363DRAFT_1429719 [Boletus edulis]|nr:hypothetical protein EV363DRAFT_1429719 [Boletus edulis]